MKNIKAISSYFIVRQSIADLETYREKTTASGLVIFIDASFETAKNVKVYAEIISAPKSFDVEEGDYLLLHKNVVTPTLMENGILDHKNDNFLYEEDGYAYYTARLDVAFGLISKDFKNIRMFKDIALVKGDDISKKKEQNGIVVDKGNVKQYENLRATVAHCNEDEEIAVGDELFLLKNANFEYEINGEKFWLLTSVGRMCLAKY